MSLVVGSPLSVTLTTTKRKWRVNLEAPLGGAYSIQAYYEDVVTDQAGNVVSKKASDVLNYPLAAIATYVFPEGVTGAQWAVNVSAALDYLFQNPPLVMASAPAQTQKVGQPYLQTNAASGGTGVIVYVLASGALPAGTMLDPATGAVSGTATTAGAVAYSIKATDSATPTPQTIANAITATIAA